MEISVPPVIKKALKVAAQLRVTWITAIRISVRKICGVTSTL